CARREVDFDYW
nr:immunoglobulin heavy chain junction region [Macaca mulatta]MOV47649.1 immunoglobulin heavy chain junction region [Macaca mulatta]MOV47877.1 immunoglobulin heavy chain junction region [Macaca mulatta]MOV48096.1 immunoglobulin heavy chain junction region [Macaca mulatta]MOV48266.1 immunoglobulin heavy chain junction region [Macaca mulatta]